MPTHTVPHKSLTQAKSIHFSFKPANPVPAQKWYIQQMMNINTVFFLVFLLFNEIFVYGKFCYSFFFFLLLLPLKFPLSLSQSQFLYIGCRVKHTHTHTKTLFLHKAGSVLNNFHAPQDRKNKIFVDRKLCFFFFIRYRLQKPRKLILEKKNTHATYYILRIYTPHQKMSLGRHLSFFLPNTK
jgi:hypothetical protein